MYDAFFISFDEPNADENWAKFSSRWPHARRIHGIRGISNAHRRCAELSYTSMFWTVDADTEIDSSIDLDFAVPIWDRDYLHLWYSRNPVNGLEYGYGAVKLWPRQRVLEFEGRWLDFTTTVGMIKIMPLTIATTRFNVDSYSAWKSGFREAIKLSKLSVSGDADSTDRLRVWTTTAFDVPYSAETRAGAIAGREYFDAHSGEIESLAMINDFERLRLHYNACEVNQDA